MYPAQLASFTPSRQIFAPGGSGGQTEIAFGVEYVLIDSTLNGFIVSDRMVTVWAGSMPALRTRQYGCLS